LGPRFTEILTSIRQALFFLLRFSAGFPFLLILAGAGALLLGFGAEMLGLGHEGQGRLQTLLNWAGAAVVLLGVAVDRFFGRRYVWTWAAELAGEPRRLAKLFGITIQVALLAFVIRQFQVENVAFYRHVMPLAAAAFLVHHFLPRNFRQPFFLCISFLGIYVVLGPAKFVWVLGLGLALIGLCHLPAQFRVRVVLLLAAAALLAAFRSGWMPAPWPGVIWPILGAMFMFRLIIYAYDLAHLKEPPGLAERLSYFFLLPNVVFPLFPVVDFKTFRRTWYDADALEIYQRGIHWMFRGLTHLLAYRFLNLYLVIPPEQVQTAGNLAHFLVVNFLLYLRISGQFHMIVGLLHLFGFHLPETNSKYCLAASFTDFWRRINIYWKDFMMKVFYYPAWFRLQKLGPQTALVLATLYVFAVTWFLHSYQWFWLRGSLLFSATDILFWSVLAALVVANSLYEARHGRKRALGKTVATPGTLLLQLFRTAAMFFGICVLWSLWTSPTPGEWFALWRVSGGWTEAFLWLSGILLFLGAGILWGHLTAAEGNGVWSRAADAVTPGRSPLATIAALLLLLTAASPALRPWLSPQAWDLVTDLRVPKLSGREAAMLRRGYYEDLVGVNTVTGQLWELFMKRPDNWVPVQASEAARDTPDFIGSEHVPSVAIIFHGEPYTTNRWGMRDLDYAQTPGPGTFRIALLGASHAVGSGVGNRENFESLLEDRLNREHPAVARQRYELLNFGFGGYNPLQQVTVLEKKALPFQPHAVFLVAHHVDIEWATAFLARRNAKGGEMPYEFVQDVLRRAGVGRGTTAEEAQKRLQPYGDELVRWAYGRIADTCRQKNILPVWILLPLEPGVPEPAAKIQRLVQMARDAGFRVVDLSGVYDGYDAPGLQVAEWDRHPNQKGHRLIAEALYRALQRQAADIPLGLAAAGPI